jgi:hypothetical protein
MRSRHHVKVSTVRSTLLRLNEKGQLCTHMLLCRCANNYYFEFAAQHNLSFDDSQADPLTCQHKVWGILASLTGLLECGHQGVSAKEQHARKPTLLHGRRIVSKGQSTSYVCCFSPSTICCALRILIVFDSNQRTPLHLLTPWTCTCT